MPDRAGPELAQTWADTVTAPDQHRDTLEPLLAEDVTMVSPLGETSGRDAVLDGLASSPIAALIAEATWGDPAERGNDAWAITATFRPGSPIGGLTFVLTIADALITRVDTEMLPAVPPDATPVALTDQIRDAVNGALENGNPMMAAYVDDDGRVHLSFRGTLQVYDHERLAMWIRNPEGGLVTAIATNPNVTLWYLDPQTRTNYQFFGRARVDPDEQTRATVFDNSPEREQNFDPGRSGLAVIMDIDRLEARDTSGAFVMDRTA